MLQMEDSTRNLAHSRFLTSVVVQFEFLLSLTLKGHIKTAEQQTIIQPLIGGLLHLVQRGGVWTGSGPASPLIVQLYQM